MEGKAATSLGGKIQSLAEMRKFERNDFDTPVMFSDEKFNRHHKAMMHNFSDHGMYFESNEPIRPGTNLYVKTMNYRSVNKCQVRWCSKIDESGNKVYGIGLECEI